MFIQILLVKRKEAVPLALPLFMDKNGD